MRAIIRAAAGSGDNRLARSYPARIETLEKKRGPPLEEDPGRVKWKDAETTAPAGLSEPGKPFVLIVIDNTAAERARR